MSTSTPIYVAVVDDDESLCRSLGRLLRASGIQPIAYASAEAFLADTKRPQFDCLVLDVQLGGVSGIELVRKLVADGGHTPFIFITAHDDPETARARRPPDALPICARTCRAIRSSRPFGGRPADGGARSR